MAQTVKNLPAVQEAWVRSLGREAPLEKGMTTHATVPLPQTPKRPLLPRPGPGALAQVRLQRKGCPRHGPTERKRVP